jgi:hypothetical protein
MENNSDKKQDQKFERHPLAHPSGGITLVDEGNVIPKAFKELL